MRTNVAWLALGAIIAAGCAADDGDVGYVEDELGWARVDLTWLDADSGCDGQQCGGMNLVFAGGSGHGNCAIPGTARDFAGRIANCGDADLGVDVQLSYWLGDNQLTRLTVPAGLPAGKAVEYTLSVPWDVWRPIAQEATQERFALDEPNAVGECQEEDNTLDPGGVDCHSWEEVPTEPPADYDPQE